MDKRTFFHYIFYSILCVILVNLCLSIWWILYGGTLLQKVVDRRFGIRYQFENARTDFFHSVWLNHVSVSTPGQGKFERVSLVFHPWVIFSRSIFLGDDFIVIELTNGQGAVVPDPATGRSITLEKLNGQIHLRSDAAKIFLQASFMKGAGLEGNVSFVPKTKDWHIQASFTNLRIEYLLPHLKNFGGKLNELAGLFNLSLDAKGRGWGRSENLQGWKAALTASELSWVPSNGGEPLHMSVQLEADPEQINLTSLTLEKDVHLTGGIKPPYTNPLMQLHVTGNNVHLTPYLKSLFPWTKGLQMSTHGSFEMDIAGTPKNPLVKSHFALRPRFGIYSAPEITGQMTLNGNELSIDSNFSGGKVNAHGHVPLGPQSSLNITVSSVSLHEMAMVNNWKNVSGTVDANILFNRTESTPHLEGDFSLHHFEWGRSSAPPVMAGSLEASDTRLDLATDDGSFTMSTSLNGPVLQLEMFHMDLMGESNVDGTGSINVETGIFDFELEGENIKPDVWPPLVSRYPDMSGHLNFQGSIRGTRDDVRAEGALGFYQLKFNPSGKEWEGKANLSLSHEEFAMNDITVEGGYAGSFLIDHRTSNPRWAVDLQINNADPALIADVFKSSYEVQGAVTGTVQLKSSHQILQGTSSMTWTNGSIDSFHFDGAVGEMKLQGDNILLENFSLIKGRQALRAEGKFSKNKKTWSFVTRVQSQQWGIPHVAFDGEGTLVGDYDPTQNKIIGDFTSPILLVNEYPVNELSLHYSIWPQSWDLEGLSKEKADIQIHYIPHNGSLSGHLSLKKIDLKKAFETFLPLPSSQGAPKGRANLNLDVSGTTIAPVCQLYVDIIEAEWRQEPFNGNIVMQINRSTTTIQGAHLNLRNNGSLYADGFIVPGQKFFINGAGQDIGLQTILHELDWPLTWDGKSNVEFILEGSQALQRATVKFHGTHNGFGPFTESGELNGQTVWENGEWDLIGIQVSAGNGFVKLQKGSRAFIEKNGSGHLHLLASVRNVRTGFLTYFGQAELTGTWRAPFPYEENRHNKVDLDIFARGLWINQFLLNGNITHLSLKPGGVEFSPISGSTQQLSGSINYTNYPELLFDHLQLKENEEERIWVNGIISRKKWDFETHLKNIDAGIIRNIFDTEIPTDGPLEAHITGHGSLENPLLDMTLLWKNGHFGVLPIDKGSAHILFSDGVIDIQDILVERKNGYRLSGKIKTGTSLTELGRKLNPDWDITLDHGNMKLLTDVWSDCKKAKGSFSGHLTSVTEQSHAHLYGFVEGSHIIILTDSYFPTLSADQVRLTYNESTVNLEKCLLHFNKGSAEAGGSLTMKGGTPINLDLYVRTTSPNGSSIRAPELAIPPGPVLSRFSLFQKKLAGVSRGDVFANLTLKGPVQEPTLAGEITLENSFVTYPPIKSANKNEHGITWFSKFLANFNQDLVFKTGQRTRFQNDSIDAKINGTLRLEGPTSNLRVNGKITTEDGNLIYAGNEFKLTDATIEIITESPNEQKNEKKEILVYAKVMAERDVYFTDGLGNNNKDTIVMSVDRALLGEIQPRFYSKSNPSMSPQKAMQLALGFSYQPEPMLGTTFNTPGQSSSQQDMDYALRASLVQVLDQSLASPIARALARESGLVDYIRVTYQNTDTTDQGNIANNPTLNSASGGQSSLLRTMKGTTVKMGRDITNDLSAGFSVKVDEYQNQVDFRQQIDLAYRVHNNFFIRASSELDSQRTLGRAPDRRALLENRWRFGSPGKKKHKQPDQKSEALEPKDRNQTSEPETNTK